MVCLCQHPGPMVTTHEARNIGISIDRDWREVYEFAHLPENFPRWASGLASSLRQDGDDWVTDTPEGEIRVRFTPRTTLGSWTTSSHSQPACRSTYLCGSWPAAKEPRSSSPFSSCRG